MRWCYFHLESIGREQELGSRKQEREYKLVGN